MNETYIKYGLVAAGIIVVLYLMRRPAPEPSSSGGAVAVDVQYSPTNDASASIAARASAFGELANLGATLASEETSRMATADVNRTARRIADVEVQVEDLRGQRALELNRFQASQVNYIAESFRKSDQDRAATALNALTSIWGAPPTYRPERRSKAADIISSVGSAVGSFFRVF